MSKPTISLCMIVKDEEKHLANCLGSVQKFVQEIIIVDTGSEDQTLAIAQKYGAKVAHFQWVDDFAAARNFSLEKASCDYILVLDADEYLDEEANLQQDLLSEKDYYTFQIKNYKTGGHSFSHQAIRMFRRESSIRYYGRVHEHPNILDSAHKLKGGDAQTLIHHVGYMDEIVAEKNKNERNFIYALKEAEENPTPYSLYNLGKSYMGTGDYAQAVEFFKKSYQLEQNRTYVYALLVHMLECLLMLNRLEEGVALAQMAQKRYPDAADFYYQMGRLYERNNYLRDAEIAYQKCLELGEAGERSFSKEGAGSFLAHYRLAVVYDQLGQQAEAFDAAHEALRVNKNYRPAMIVYLQLMLKAGIPKGEVVKHLAAVYPITNVEELKVIIGAMYELKHPLLVEFLSIEHQQQLSPDIKAIAMQYGGSYQQAKEIWLSLPEISEENVHDMLILALVLQDPELFKLMRKPGNLKEQNWIYLEKVITRKGGAPQNVEQENILLNLCVSLIVMEEFECFEYISSLIIAGSIDCHCRLGRILVDYGFISVALDLGLADLESEPGHSGVLELVGDAYYRLGQYTEACHFYQRTANLDPGYIYFQKIYDALVRQELKQEAEVVKHRMGQFFPLSKWAKSKS